MRVDGKSNRHVRYDQHVSDVESIQKKHGAFMTLQQKGNRCLMKTVLIARYELLGQKIKRDEEEQLYRRAEIISRIINDKPMSEVKDWDKILRVLLEEEGLKTREIHCRSKEVAIRKLYHALNSWPVILNVDKAGHWVVARSVRHGATPCVLAILDPQRTKKNLIYAANPRWEESELCRRWWDKSGGYYAIVVKT